MLYFHFFPHQQQIQIVERFNAARENVVYTCSVQQGKWALSNIPETHHLLLWKKVVSQGDIALE